MHNRQIIIAVTIFVLIIVGMFTYTYIKRGEINQIEPPSETRQEEQPGPYDFIDRIEAKHFFIDGTHTIVGEIVMPTPCDLLNWEVFVAESYPEQVTIEFSVINNSEMCTQVMTPQRFKVTFDASEEAVIRARLEGRDVELNLIPAGEGETPEEFELFIKG